jgi:hypothetical protein
MQLPVLEVTETDVSTSRLPLCHLHLPDIFLSFFYWYSGGEVQLGPLSTAATNGLLCQPRVIMMMEKLVE